MSNLQRFRLSGICSVTVLALAAACAPDQSDTALFDDALSKVDAAIPSIMEKTGAPGLAIAVVKNGETIWSKGYGVTQLGEGGTPVTPDTIFEAASLSKPLFAYILTYLVEDGLLDLDDNFGERFAYARLDHDPRYEELSSRMILSHGAGLPNWVGSALDIDRDDRIDFLRDPDEGFNYSGEAYTLLQNFVESRTDEGLEATYQRLDISDAMPSSSYIARNADHDRFALGYSNDGDGRAIIELDTALSAGSLVSTANDFAAFVARVMSEAGDVDGVLRGALDPETLVAGDEWGADLAELPDGELSWSLGWGVQDSDGQRIHFHWGDNGAFKSIVAFNLATNTGVVFFANSIDGLKSFNSIVAPIVGDMSLTAAAINYGEAE